jgi:predicted small secreted protein
MHDAVIPAQPASLLRIKRELDCAARFGEIAPDLRGIFRMRKLIVLAAAASALLVASCNTIAGAGKDVSAAGKAVTRTADDAKH